MLNASIRCSSFTSVKISRVKFYHASGQTYVFLLNLSIQKLCYKWRNAKEIVILQQHPKKPSDIEYKMYTISTFLSDLFSLSLIFFVTLTTGFPPYVLINYFQEQCDLKDQSQLMP